MTRIYSMPLRNILSVYIMKHYSRGGKLVGHWPKKEWS